MPTASPLLPALLAPLTEKRIVVAIVSNLTSLLPVKQTSPRCCLWSGDRSPFRASHTLLFEFCLREASLLVARKEFAGVPLTREEIHPSCYRRMSPRSQGVSLVVLRLPCCLEPSEEEALELEHGCPSGKITASPPCCCRHLGEKNLCPCLSTTPWRVLLFWSTICCQPAEKPTVEPCSEVLEFGRFAFLLHWRVVAQSFASLMLWRKLHCHLPVCSFVADLSCWRLCRGAGA